jgi:hypothetical protein
MLRTLRCICLASPRQRDYLRAWQLRFQCGLKHRFREQIVSPPPPNETGIVMSDPTALGVFGLVIVTFMAASQKTGWTSSSEYLIPWALFLGSIAQIWASTIDFKKNNYFGAIVLGAYGQCHFHLSQVAALVESEEPIFEVGMPTIGPVQLAIAAYVADLIEDGSTLQIGYGGIPDTVVTQLSRKKISAFIPKCSIVQEKQAVRWAAGVL